MVKPIPDGYHTVTPYLVVRGVAELIDFLERAFGATRRSDFRLPDGRVMHAEVAMGDSIVMMGEAGKEHTPSPTHLHVYVEDVDAAYQRARKAGGESVREPENQFYGDRSAGIKDPSGNTWWLTTHVEDVDPEELKRRMQALG